MFIVSNYGLAVLLCVLTMLCWGSWANTQKLASRKWSFQLFYWDYAIGVLLFAVLLAFSLGSHGSGGRSFLPDLMQAEPNWIASAFIGGVIFNLSNILLVAAIDLAGMAVAFPVGVGLALVLGVGTTYWARPEGNVPLLTIGVAGVAVAIVLDALAYKKLSSNTNRTPTKGIVLAVLAGLLMGLFYSFVARAMAPIDPVTHTLQAGMLSPYTAIVVFSTGLLLSTFVWNSIFMAKPVVGPPIRYSAYFTEGNARLHAVGILGGMIWSAGMSFSILASNAAGPALSYGLGQCATLVGAMWGVFIWKEFNKAPAGTNRLLAAMFLFYMLGLGCLIASKL